MPPLDIKRGGYILSIYFIKQELILYRLETKLTEKKKFEFALL